MALYDGFFDAALDSSGSYDRAYDSQDFSEYFSGFLGSGVSIVDNENSFLVRAASGGVVVSPGILFIAGRWLKNDADYVISLASAGEYAIVATLSTAGRYIQLEAVTRQDGGYTNGLVLAYVSVSGTAITVEDTRYNTDICGVIDAPGNVKGKIEYALDYLDNEVQPILTATQASVNNTLSRAGLRLSEAEGKIDAAVKEVEDATSELSPPAIGTVRYMAEAPTDGKWLLCDGRYVGEETYPDLVAVLNKHTFSPPAINITQNYYTGRNFSNGFLHDGYLWVYSYDDKCLYGMGINKAWKKIPVSAGQESGSSEQLSSLVSPAVYPIGLTIQYNEVIISQIRSQTSISILKGAFSSSSTRITVECMMETYRTSSTGTRLDDLNTNGKPNVATNGQGTYWFSGGDNGYNQYYYQWRTTYSSVLERKYSSAGAVANTIPFIGSVYGFNAKNGMELLVPQNTWVSYLANPYTHLQSFDGGGYNRPQQQFRFENILTNIGAENISQTSGASGKNLSPIYGNGAVLADAEISNGRKYAGTSGSAILYGFNRDGVWFINKAAQGYLPTGSRIFPDGAVYVAQKGMWFVFVGTGIIFANDITDGDSYGFLDTTVRLGTITQYGYIDYNESTGHLCITGVDNAGNHKFATIGLSTWNYSESGVYLPTLKLDTIPGYIKALEG